MMHHHFAPWDRVRIQGSNGVCEEECCYHVSVGMRADVRAGHTSIHKRHDAERSGRSSRMEADHIFGNILRDHQMSSSPAKSWKRVDDSEGPPMRSPAKRRIGKPRRYREVKNVKFVDGAEHSECQSTTCLAGSAWRKPSRLLR